MANRNTISPQKINSMLLSAGHTQASMARALGVNAVSVCNVVNGRLRSRRIAQAISDAVKIPIRDLWPGKYRCPHEIGHP